MEWFRSAARSTGWGQRRAIGGAGDRFAAFSAGTEATKVRPEAVRVMAEVGVDISRQQSKTVERYIGEPSAWLCRPGPWARSSRHIGKRAERPEAQPRWELERYGATAR